MNYEKDLEIIEGFVGKECERTLACNTLKIRFGEKNPYIWIDPPWQLFRNEVKITASIDYPEEEEGFRVWSETLNPLNRTVLTKYDYSVKDGLSLYFSNVYRLNAPTTLDVIDAEDFYSHWYAQG